MFAYMCTYILNLVPCEINDYKMQTTEYDEDSIISVEMNKAFTNQINVTVPKDTKANSMMLSFLKTEVDRSEEISLSNIPDFISSVGGNLGLFTGFSFLSALITLVDWVRRIPLKCSSP